jgi:hypothetical protein
MFVSAPCLRRGGAFAARRTDGRQPIKCTICGDPAYIELRVGLVAALAPFPEARQAVAAVLHTIEGKAADAVRSETRELAHDGLAGHGGSAPPAPASQRPPHDLQLDANVEADPQ